MKHVLAQACPASLTDPRHARHVPRGATALQPSIQISSLGVACESGCICDSLAARLQAM